jgi:hypothetical protein
VDAHRQPGSCYQLIGTISGANTIEGLAYDPGNNLLYGLSASQGRIFILDTFTAVATPLPNALSSSGVWRGLTFDTQLGVLWASQVISGEVHSADPVTGIGTFVGVTASYVQGLGFKGASPVAPITLTIAPGPTGSVVFTASNVPPGTTNGWTLPSATLSGGAGPILGLLPDSLTLALINDYLVPIPGNPIHWTYPVVGGYPDSSFFVPASAAVLFAGQTWDWLLVAVDASANLSPAGVITYTW